MFICCINKKYKNKLIKNGFKLVSQNNIGDTKCWMLICENVSFDLSKLDMNKVFISDKMYF